MCDNVNLESRMDVLRDDRRVMESPCIEFFQVHWGGYLLTVAMLRTDGFTLNMG